MTVIEGVDYSFSRPSPAALVSAGKRFACRYLSWHTSAAEGKILDRAELDALLRAGLAVVLNWEFDVNDFRGGRAAGTENAAEAARQASALGYPGAVIYFSIDQQVSSATDMRLMEAYVGGIAVTLGRERVGFYGGRQAILWAKALGITYLWQTYAWSDVDNDGDADWVTGVLLQQYRNGVGIGGQTVDLTRATADYFGQIGGEIDMTPEQDKRLTHVEKIVAGVADRQVPQDAETDARLARLEALLREFARAPVSDAQLATLAGQVADLVVARVLAKLGLAAIETD